MGERLEDDTPVRLVPAFLFSLILGLAIPLALYVLLGRAGLDVSGTMLRILLAAVGLNLLLIVARGGGKPFRGDAGTPAGAWPSSLARQTRRLSAAGEGPDRGSSPLAAFDRSLWQVAYPWISLQVVAVLAYLIWQAHGLHLRGGLTIPALLAGLFVAGAPALSVLMTLATDTSAARALWDSETDSITARIAQVRLMLLGSGPLGRETLSAAVTVEPPVTPVGEVEPEPPEEVQRDPVLPDREEDAGPQLAADDDLIAAAMRVEESVARLVRDVEGQEGEYGELRAKVAALERQVARYRAAQDVLGTIAATPVEGERLQAMEAVLQSLRTEPGNILALAALAQHAAALSTILAQYAALHRALTEPEDR